VISFFLPAVRSVHGAGGSLCGGLCAAIASVAAPKALLTSLGHKLRTEEILIPIGGVVNYLFLAISVLSIWRRFVRIRIVLGLVMFPCFAAAWMYFAISHMAPLVGHHIWIVACILIVFPDAVSAVRVTRPNATTPHDASGRIPAGS
jgi:hypothetical protein